MASVKATKPKATKIRKCETVEQVLAKRKTNGRRKPKLNPIPDWVRVDLAASGLTPDDIEVQYFTEEESKALGLKRTGECYWMQYRGTGSQETSLRPASVQ
jgi:hypothetical protein